MGGRARLTRQFLASSSLSSWCQIACSVLRLNQNAISGSIKKWRYALDEPTDLCTLVKASLFPDLRLSMKNASCRPKTFVSNTMYRELRCKRCPAELRGAEISPSSLTSSQRYWPPLKPLDMTLGCCSDYKERKLQIETTRKVSYGSKHIHTRTY